MKESHKDALSQIVRIAREHRLRTADIHHALQQAHHQDEKPFQPMSWISFFYYMGALFLFSGIISYSTVYWHSFSSQNLSISFILTGSVAFFIASVLLQRLSVEHNWRDRKLIYLLFLVAVFCQMLGLFFAFDELSVLFDKPETINVIVFAALSLSAWIAARAVFHEPIMTICVVYTSFFWFSLFDRLRINENLNYVVIGLCVCLAAYYFSRHYKHVFYRAWYLLGSAVLQCGILDSVLNRWVEFLFPLFILGLLQLSLKIKEKTLFFSGTIGLLVYVNTLLYRFLAKSLNVPVLFVIAGFLCILLGVGMAKIYRKRFLEEGRRL